MNDSSACDMGVIFCIEMPKSHYYRLCALFGKLSLDLFNYKYVTNEDYAIFMAFLEAMENK